MPHAGKKIRVGMTLPELMVAMVISMIPMLVVGGLLASGQRSWNQAYNSAHKKIKTDATAANIAFSSIARKSNRANYIIYEHNGSTFTPAVPPVNQTSAKGQAVEFRYWNNNVPTNAILDTSNQGTHYALFYVAGEKLKINYGQVDPSGVGAVNGSTLQMPDSTVVIAENVTAVEFNHETTNGVGRGSVRGRITIPDNADGVELNIMLASLLRNIWPR